jgi:protein-tyrosine phosphatase
MADFDMVTARLATGAAISRPDDVLALAAVGVTHVLDCRDDFDDGPLLSQSGCVYLWNPTPDDGQPKPDLWWRQTLSFAVNAYSRLGTCVYAHCAAGINRGPSAAYAIMRACWGLPSAASISMIKIARPQALVGYAADFERYWAANPPGR